MVLGVEKDDTRKIGVQLFLALAGQSRHIFHIHLGFLSDGKCQGFACRIHAVNGNIGLNGAFMEHICLAFKLALFVQHLQGAKQKIGVVVAEHGGIGTAVDAPVLFDKGIVFDIQTLLQNLDVSVVLVFKLGFDQSSCGFPKPDHPLDAVLPRYRGFHGCHDAVLSVIDLTAHKRVREVFDTGIGNQSAVILPVLGFFPLNFGDLGVQIGNRRLQKFYKVFPIEWAAGGFGTVLSASHLDLSKHHFGVIEEILVDGDPVLGLSKVYPIGFCLDDAVTLLQKENVRHHLLGSRAVEGVVGQTNGTDQVGSLRHILSCHGIFLVHGSAACHKGNDPTGAHLVQGFGEKVVMNQKIMLVISPIRELEISERHVANRHVKEAVGEFGLFISVDGDAVLLIELARDPSRKAV